MNGAMRNVELVEDDPTGAGTPTPAEPRTRRRRHVPRWIWFVTAGAVVAAAGTQLGLDAHERAQVDRYAHTPGFVEHLRPPLRTAWSAPGDDQTLWFPLVTVAAVQISGVVDNSNATEVAATNLRDGGRMWRTQISDAPTKPTDAGHTDNVTVPPCVLVQPAHDGEPVSHLMCLTTGDRTYFTNDTNGGQLHRTFGTSADLNLIDLASGQVTSTAHTGPAEALDAIGSKVVLAHTLRDGTADVRLLDTTTGATSWRFRTPSSPPDATDTSVNRSSVWRVADEVIVIDGNGQLNRLALANGTPVAPPQRTDRAQVANARDRAWLSGIPDQGNDLTKTGTLVLGVGRDVTVPGQPLRATADDGTAPGLLFSANAAGFDAYDETTRKPRWHATASIDSDVVVLDHTIYGLDNDGTIWAVDARDGRTKWSTKAAAQGIGPTPLMTDGYHVFTVASDPHAQQEHLVALDKHTGAIAWRATLPPDTAWLTVVDHLLVAQNQPAARLTS